MKFLIASAVMAGFLAGCGAEDSAELAESSAPKDEVGELATTLTNYTFKAQFKDYKSEKRTDGRNSTQQAVLDLNKYAGELVEEVNAVVKSTLAEKGIEPGAILKPGKLYIQSESALPGRTRNDACFWENKLYSTSTLDRDLSSDRHIGYAVEQLQNLAKMIGHQSLLMGSRPLGSLNFHEVQLCTVKQSSRIMNFDPGSKVLQVSIYEPSHRVNKWETFSFTELQKMWNMGVQFTASSSKVVISDDFLVSAARGVYMKIKGKEAHYKVWQVINPIGSYRSVMRDLFRQSSSDVLAKLRKSYGTERGDEEQEKRSLIATLQLELLNRHSELYDSDLAEANAILANRADLLGELRALPLSEVRKVMRRWAHVVSHKKNMVDLENGAMRSVSAKINKFSARIKTKITGFIAVGNAHAINVNANLFPKSDLQSYTKADVADVNSTDVDIEAEVKGFVAVFTNDVVNVNADVGGSIGTAGFVKALDSVVGNVDFGEAEL